MAGSVLKPKNTNTEACCHNYNNRIYKVWWKHQGKSTQTYLKKSETRTEWIDLNSVWLVFITRPLGAPH